MLINETNENCKESDYLGFSDAHNAHRVSELVSAYNELHAKCGETTVVLSYRCNDNRFTIRPCLPDGTSFTVRVEDKPDMPSHPDLENRKDTDEVLTDNGDMEDLLFQIVEEHVKAQGGIAT